MHDTPIYRVIRSIQDQHVLRKDQDNSQEWATIWDDLRAWGVVGDSPQRILMLQDAHPHPSNDMQTHLWDGTVLLLSVRNTWVFTSSTILKDTNTLTRQPRNSALLNYSETCCNVSSWLQKAGIHITGALGHQWFGILTPKPPIQWQARRTCGVSSWLQKAGILSICHWFTRP